MSLWSTLSGSVASGSTTGLTSQVSLIELGTSWANASPTSAPTLGQFYPTTTQAVFTSTSTAWTVTVPRISKITIEGDDVVLWRGGAEWMRLSLAMLRDALGPVLEKALLGAFK